MQNVKKLFVAILILLVIIAILATILIFILVEGQCFSIFPSHFC